MFTVVVSITDPCVNQQFWIYLHTTYLKIYTDRKEWDEFNGKFWPWKLRIKCYVNMVDLN